MTVYSTGKAMSGPTVAGWDSQPLRRLGGKLRTFCARVLTLGDYEAAFDPQHHLDFWMDAIRSSDHPSGYRRGSAR